MPYDADKSNHELTLSTGGDAPMTAEQAKLLKQLALDAYEPDAFSAHLTHGDAERRIAMLQAKLKLMDDPPHTL
jgi:uncharacterized protein (UPF0276 family)